MISSRLDNTIIKINLPPDRKYGFMLSGGLDSAVLLYLILKNNLSVNLQLFSIKKHDGSYRCLDNIIQFLENRTDTKLSNIIFIGDPNADHDQQSNTAIREIEEKFLDIDYVIFGTNSNPPGDVHLPGLYPRRERRFNPKILTPFRHLYKTHIVDFVFEHNLEPLLEMTHTCTEKVNDRCGKCFQCNERIWAFEELGYTDTGVK